MIHLDPGIYEDLPEQDYRALEAAAQSDLKEIEISVAHWLERRSRDESPSESMMLGTALHTLILDGKDAFADRYAITPKHEDGKDAFRKANGKPTDNWSRTSAYRDWCDEQESEGRTVLTREQAQTVRNAGVAVLEHEAAANLLQTTPDQKRTENEISLVWQDDTFDVPCKCRFDRLHELGGQMAAVDLKTTFRGNAREGKFSRHAARYGYGMQAHHYDEGWRALHNGEGLAAWLAVVVEMDPPFGVAVYHFTETWFDAAYSRRMEALEHYARWYHDGRPDEGPAYPETIRPLDAPSWA